MEFGGIVLISTVSLFNIVYSQPLIPLYGACSKSVQCIGVAQCDNEICQCPSSYNAVGITCIYSADAEIKQEPSPPVAVPAGSITAANPQVSAPGASAIGAGPPPLTVPGAPFAYPGLPCSPGKTCIGNSVCVQGMCGCPAGQVVAGYTCVAPPPGPAFPMPAPGPVPAASPYAPMPRPALSVASGPYPMPPYGPFPGDDELDIIFGPRGPPPPGIPYPGGPGGPYPGGPYPFPAATCPPAQVPLGPVCLPPTAIVNYPSPVSCQPAVPVPCVGGAACVGSVCACTPPLVWSGSTCVPPPPPPPPVPVPPPPPPAPAPALPQMIYPAPAPVPVRPPYVPGPALPVAAPVPAPGQLPVGAPCSAHGQCVFGAYCPMGVCQCRPAFLPYGSICVLRRRARDEAEKDQDEKVEKEERH